MRIWPAGLVSTVERIGEASVLAGALLGVMFRPTRWLGPMLREAERQAGDALLLVMTLAALGGALVAQQTGYQFQGTLPPWVVGSIVAASVITEMAPLCAGFAFVGVVGTRIAAEVATMQVTNQIEALQVIGRDPVEYLVAPRVLAAAFIAPVLMCFALVAAMLAGWFTALFTTRATSIDFWFGVRHYMHDFPMFYPLIKGFVSGAAITFAACLAGLSTQGGSAGVGLSVRRAVVWMIATIIFVDTALVPLLKVVGT